MVINNKRLQYIFLIFFGLIFEVTAQVGINTTTPEAALDVFSEDRGIIVPRFSLSSAIDVTQVTNPSEGELIFNTYKTPNNSSLPLNYRVTQGYYYWFNNRWNRVADDVKIPRFSINYTTSGHHVRFPLNESNSEGEWRTLSWDDGTYWGEQEISFTAPYSGVYQIVLNANYSLGYTKIGAPYTLGVGEAIFRTQVFINKNVSNSIYPDVEFDVSANALSAYSNRFSSQLYLRFYQLPKYSTVIRNVRLEAGDVCNMRVQVDEVRLSTVSMYNASFGRSWTGYDSGDGYDNSISVRLIGK